MTGVAGLFQKMTTRKTSGFNVWQNAGDNDKSFREARRSVVGPGIIAKDSGAKYSSEYKRNSYMPQSTAYATNNVNNNNNNSGNNNGNVYTSTNCVLSNPNVNGVSNPHAAISNGDWKEANNLSDGKKKSKTSDGKLKTINADVNRIPSSHQKLTASKSLMTNGKDMLSSQSAEVENAIGNYALGRTLGKGTFAKVKLAKHLPTGKEVAIKIIDKTQLSDSDIIKIYREIRIMKILNHPNIVRLYEVIETERYLHLVLEYVPKGEIFDFVVKNGRLHEAEARKKFRQIISAIEYCHRKCIVHRDLKVENLLLDSQMGIKICDFGFSNEFTTNGKLNTFCGSPPYAAPELFLGKNYVGPEVDVWSLGIVLYTLLCGALPFDGRSVKELKERIMKGAYHVPAYLSQQSRDMIKKFLCVMPSRRISLQSAMNEVWLNQGHELNPLKPFHEQEESIDYNKIDYMTSLGYDRERLLESVRGERFDDLFATYKLTTMQKSEQQTPIRVESNATFLSTPLRRSLRDSNPANTTTDNKTPINSFSMRIPPGQNHVPNLSYQSTNFGNPRSAIQRTSGASGLRGSNNNISGEAVLRKNGPPPETRYKRVTTGQISAITQKTYAPNSKNGIYKENALTMRNSFKDSNAVSYFNRLETKNLSTINPNVRYISRNETQTSFLKKPKPLKSHHPSYSVSMSTRSPSVTSHQVVGSRRSTADLSTMNGSRLGSRSVSMKGSTTKLISSSKTSLAPSQSSIQSLNVAEIDPSLQTSTTSNMDSNISKNQSGAPASKDSAHSVPTDNSQHNVAAVKSGRTDVVVAQKSKSAFGGWFKRKKTN